jgi:hypothetical protein
MAIGLLLLLLQPLSLYTINKLKKRRLGPLSLKILYWYGVGR